MGRKIASVIGLWLVIKACLNLALGFSTENAIIGLATVVIVYMFGLGVPYLNYITAGLMAIVVVKNLPYNITHFQLLYLAEAVIDVVCIVILVTNQEVKKHFERL